MGRKLIGYFGGIKMECIRKFMQDSYQAQLKMFAQSKSERYEDAIESYKQIFLVHLGLVKKDCLDECNYDYTCKHIRAVVNSIQENEVIQFFDELKQVYLDWINSEIIKAIERLDKLMNEYGLCDFEKENKECDVFFKGRVAEQVLTTWDMFHIPFNKRYLIGNQRFSLTGCPMLYIGSSVIDVAEEIGANSIENLKISTIQLPKEGLKIYDLRNNIHEEYIDILLGEFFDIDLNNIYNKANFFKMILCSVCSFKKRQDIKGFTFCEEYVIPQILAQILKGKGFKGIAYYSTKRYNQLTFDNMNENDMDNVEFKENIAIFTELNEEHVYDKNLYDTITMSVPIDIKKIYNIKFSDLEEIKNEIALTEDQEKITFAETVCSSFNRTYKSMKINDKLYVDTDYGKLHLYELYTVLNDILVA